MEYQLQEVKTLYQQRSVKLSEIPEIKNYVITKVNSNLFNKTGELNQAIFDVDNILEVIDTLNNVNYTFQFTLPKTSLGTFYNLVIGKTPKGKLVTPFVLKYKCDAAYLEQYIESGFNFRFFKGTIALHKYTDFFGEGYFSRIGETLCPPEYDEVGDPISCNTQPLDGGRSTSDVGGGGTTTSDGSFGDGTTTGGDTGGGGYTGDGGSGSSCSWSMEFLTGDCPDGCGCESGICGYDVLVIDCGDYFRSQNATSSKEGDCPDCTPDNDGAIGILTADLVDFAYIINVFTNNLNLTPEGLDWISSPFNVNEVRDIYAYLERHKDPFGNYTNEAKSFGEQIIETLMDGGEVDLVNEIIKDSTFVGSKADCVYELLKSTNNNLFKDVMSAFTNDNVKFKLKFRIGSVPSGADGSTTYDEDSGIITITFPPAINFLTSLEVAAILLHEGIHAELRRIYQGNNQGLEPLSTDQFNYLVSLWEYYIGTSPASLVSNNASHTFMVHNHVQPLANAIREFDNNSYPLDNYMWFGWDGLSAIGKITVPQLLTRTQESNFIDLQQIPLTDSIKHSCDE